MLKTVAAALLTASIFVAPAMAANGKIVHANPLNAKAAMTTSRVVVKPAVKKVGFFSHHRHHHKMHRHGHRHHYHR